MTIFTNKIFQFFIRAFVCVCACLQCRIFERYIVARHYLHQTNNEWHIYRLQATDLFRFHFALFSIIFQHFSSKLFSIPVVSCKCCGNFRTVHSNKNGNYGKMYGKWGNFIPSEVNVWAYYGAYLYHWLLSINLLRLYHFRGAMRCWQFSELFIFLFAWSKSKLMFSSLIRIRHVNKFAVGNTRCGTEITPS